MDRCSSMLQRALAALQAGTAQALLRLDFAASQVVVDATSPGKSVTPTEATKEPVLSLASSVASQNQNGQKYMAVSLDPDAPFPSFPVLGPIVHGIQTDLTVDAAAPASSPWARLTSTVEPLVSYIKPGPPSPSSAHRYVFVLWKQPEGLDAAAIKTRLGWAADQPIARMARMRFNVNTMIEKLELGDIVAINYFQSQQGGK